MQETLFDVKNYYKLDNLSEVHMQLLVLSRQASELSTINSRPERDFMTADIADYLSLIKEHCLSLDVLIEKITREIIKGRILKQ